MQQFESLVAFIAPHYCNECGKEGQLLCFSCATELYDESACGCVFCGSPAVQSQVCASCHLGAPLEQVWALGSYDGMREMLIHQLKFGGMRAAHLPLAWALARVVPQLPENTVVVPLPTAPRRMRQRGFDHAVLLAKSMAKARRLAYWPLLERMHNNRQVGSSRSERLEAAGRAYRLAKSRPSIATPLLLVDDVVTTGASMGAAARECAAAGFTRLFGAVVARQPPK